MVVFLGELDCFPFTFYLFSLRSDRHLGSGTGSNPLIGG